MFFFLSEAQCDLFPSNCAAEVKNFSHRAVKLGQYRKSASLMATVCLSDARNKFSRLSTTFEVGFP